MRVRDLRPGDKIEQEDGSGAVFVAAAPHPDYPGLALVVWAEVTLPPWLTDDEDTGWSIDALDWRQEVGDALTETPEDSRGSRLQRVFHRVKKEIASSWPADDSSEEEGS